MFREDVDDDDMAPEVVRSYIAPEDVLKAKETHVSPLIAAAEAKRALKQSHTIGSKKVKKAVYDEDDGDDDDEDDGDDEDDDNWVPEEEKFEDF